MRPSTNQHLALPAQLCIRMRLNLLVGEARKFLLLQNTLRISSMRLHCCNNFLQFYNRLRLEVSNIASWAPISNRSPFVCLFGRDMLNWNTLFSYENRQHFSFTGQYGRAQKARCSCWRYRSRDTENR